MIGFLAATPAERRLIPGGAAGHDALCQRDMMFVLVVDGAAAAALGSRAMVAAGVTSHSVEIADGAARRKKRKHLPLHPESHGAEGQEHALIPAWLGPAALVDGPAGDIDVRSRKTRRGSRWRLRPIVSSGQVRRDAWRPHRTRRTVLGAVARLKVALNPGPAIALAPPPRCARRAGHVDTHRSGRSIERHWRPTTRWRGVPAQDRARRAPADGRGGRRRGGAAAIAGGGSTWLADLTGGPLLGSRDVLLLALLPLAGTILATILPARRCSRR